METIEIRCPECGAHAATLTQGAPARSASLAAGDVALVAPWALLQSAGEFEPSALWLERFRRECEAPGAEMMTQRRFASALLELGWVWKKLRSGRVYARP